MQLPGRLAVTTLGDLLGRLYRERASGVLELVEHSGVAAGRTHRVHIDAGLVRDVETTVGAPRLGELLAAEGLLAKGALTRLAQRLAAEPGRRAGDVLVAEQLVSPSVVGAGLRRQLRLRLDALFALRDAALRFRVALRRSADRDRVPLSPHEFLHGRPRRREQRRAPVGSAQSKSPPAPDRKRAEAFEVLGLRPGADRQEVQQAFRQLARRLHPDRHPRATEAERIALLRRFARVSAAYHALVA